MDSSDLLRTGLALVCTLGLIGLTHLLLRRIGGGAALPKRGKLRRLQLQEILLLDNRRKLVLVSCDGQEHLLLVGAQGEQLITTLPSSAEVAESQAEATSPGPALVKKEPALSGDAA